MRDVARDVHRELEATRAELKQGVLNLPEEAEESTSALRKVVNEQIARADRTVRDRRPPVERARHLAAGDRTAAGAAAARLPRARAARPGSRRRALPQPVAQQQAPQQPELRAELRPRR
jgi:hypothetical protein